MQINTQTVRSSTHCPLFGHPPSASPQAHSSKAWVPLHPFTAAPRLWDVDVAIPSSIVRSVCHPISRHFLNQFLATPSSHALLRPSVAGVHTTFPGTTSPQIPKGSGRKMMPRRRPDLGMRTGTGPRMGCEWTKFSA